MQSVKIQASTNLSKDEVEKLKKEAAEHAAEDAKKKTSSKRATRPNRSRTSRKNQ